MPATGFMLRDHQGREVAVADPLPTPAELAAMTWNRIFSGPCEYWDQTVEKTETPCGGNKHCYLGWAWFYAAAGGNHQCPRGPDLVDQVAPLLGVAHYQASWAWHWHRSLPELFEFSQIIASGDNVRERLDGLIARKPNVSIKRL